MALERTVVDEPEPAPGVVCLPADAMARLGVERGDVVTVAGRRRTAAVVGAPLETTAGLAAGTDVRRNAALDTGAVARVDAATTAAATGVTVAPPEAIRFEGELGAVETALRGRAVTRDDAVRVSLFGGSLDVTFTVTDVDPSEPALVTESTAITVTDDPVLGGAGPPAGGARAAGYDDVAGLDRARRRLRQLVEVPLERPALYDRLGAGTPGGVLVHGPTGVGKTLLADALGNEVDAAYIRVADPAELAGGREDGFGDLAERARAAAPAVVFLDDVDAVAPAGGGQSASAPTGVRSFMDAVADDAVAVVGATTDPDDVDPALRRGGRFDHELALDAPDRDGRFAVLRTLTAGVALESGVDLASVAARTHGFVGADLLALVREAVRNAVGRLPDAVQFGDEPLTEYELAELSVTAEDLAAGLSAVTPGGMRESRMDHPEVSYADVGGATAAKRRVIRAVEWPVRYPELFDHLASDPPSGVLLHGLPGTGKTLLARAVASATDANFLAVDGPELLDRYVGESERGVRDLFDRARRHAPTVVFFDELDALAPTRDGDASAEVTERVVSQLLTELDGIEPRGGVVVIGATNRPDMIDPALLRPGRLETAVEMPLPDRAARREIFEIHARDIPTDAVDFDGLAGRTEGYTGGDIAAVVREAALTAMERYLADRSFEFDPEAADLSDLRVGPADFEAALDAVHRSVTDRMRERYADRAGELAG